MCYSSHVSKLHTCIHKQLPFSQSGLRSAPLLTKSVQMAPKGKSWSPTYLIGNPRGRCGLLVGPFPWSQGLLTVGWSVARIKLECSHLKCGPRVRALFACFRMEFAIWKGISARKERRTIQYVGVVPVCVSLLVYPGLCMSACVDIWMYLCVCFSACSPLSVLSPRGQSPWLSSHPSLTWVDLGL